MQSIYGIALGPGDPELLTLKALRILKEVDVIYYPGSVNKGVQQSFVYPMLQYHQLEHKELIGFFLEMSYNRSQAKTVYQATANAIAQHHKSGKKIAIVCEGDLSLYASFSYLLAALQDLKLPIDLVPGINAFSLGAAQHKVPLSLLNDKIAIVPRVKSVADLQTYFEQFDTLVLMKIKTVWHTLQPELLQQKWHCYYCERLGTDNEFITTALETLTHRDIPYFSLLIIKK